MSQGSGAVTTEMIRFYCDARDYAKGEVYFREGRVVGLGQEADADRGAYQCGRQLDA